MSAKRTTVRLEESLLEQAKAEAARRNKTLTAMLEVGLRLALVNPSTPGQAEKSDAACEPTRWRNHAGIDIGNRADLLDILEGRGWGRSPAPLTACLPQVAAPRHSPAWSASLPIRKRSSVRTKSVK
jgi:hypothetical protein